MQLGIFLFSMQSYFSIFNQGIFIYLLIVLLF